MLTFKTCIHIQFLYVLCSLLSVQGSFSLLNPTVPEFTPAVVAKPVEIVYNVPHSSEIRPFTQHALVDFQFHESKEMSGRWDRYFYASLEDIKHSDQLIYSNMHKDLTTL